MSLNRHFASPPESLALFCDLYEFTMSNGYYELGMKDSIAYFDLFFRKVPDGGGFAVMAGLSQLIDYLRDFEFSSEDISFLRENGSFSEGFLSYLQELRFSCDVWAVPEGTPVFPGEPLVTVRGPIIEAQLIETMALMCINHQTLIATKANRIVRAAAGRRVLEFGARRAHGPSAALYGARAAYIGGCDATSLTSAGQAFGMPCSGTMAHSWVQSFDSELEAFRAYSKLYPDGCVLLVDTYDTLGSGIPNAITVFKELAERGLRPGGIRIDSGDITYLSKRARKMLDAAGFPECDILASNSLDEIIVQDMLLQGADVDCFGIGERLITASSDPVLGCVYKLVAMEDAEGNIIPKIKLSDNVSKITVPFFKQAWRLFDYDTGKAIADVVAMHHETIDDSKPYELFDPEYVWKRKTVERFIARRLTTRIFDGGECVYTSPEPSEIRAYCRGQVATLWDEVTRMQNPHGYYIDLSQELYDGREHLIKRP